MIRIFQSNAYLKYYSIQPWTFVCHKLEKIPYFMEGIIDKAIELYVVCKDINFEELLQYCFDNDNWYVGFRLLHVKPEFEKLNKELEGILLWSVLDKQQKITDYFYIKLKYAIYALILCLTQEKMISINSVDEILNHENLRKPHNKYALTKLDDADFFRQGFRVENTYYLYNIFLDTAIGSPLDEVPYILRIIIDEIPNANIYMRCDCNLGVPYDSRTSTATIDAQKYRGININFANIESLIYNKEIIVHIHSELLHKIVLIIKPDKEYSESFYHIEVEQIWYPEKLMMILFCQIIYMLNTIQTVSILNTLTFQLTNMKTKFIN